MSDSGGPTRRRRIAGESNPAAKKPAAKKATVKKAAVKSATAKKTTTKKTTAKKTTPKKTTPKKATPPKAPTKKVATAKPAVPAKKVATAAPAKRGATAAPKSDAPTRPAAPHSAAGGPATRRDLRWLVPAALVALASLVVGGLLAFQGLQDITDDNGGREANEKAASSAASAAAETIFSYTYNKLDEHLADSKKLMTSSFATDFEKIAPALDDIAPQRKVQVQAVSRNAAALSCGDECSPGTVNVLVFLDQARLVDGAKDPDVIGNRITMKMVRRDGVWLVDDIRAV